MRLLWWESTTTDGPRWFALEIPSISGSFLPSPQSEESCAAAKQNARGGRLGHREAEVFVLADLERRVGRDVDIPLISPGHVAPTNRCPDGGYVAERRRQG